MKWVTKSEVLRIFCWLFVVILPTALACWFMDIHSSAAVAIAIPFMLLAERLYRKLLQRYGLWEPDSK